MHSPRSWRLSRRAALATLAAMAAAPAAVAQSGAHRPIRLVVGFGPGSINDLTARELARYMAESLGSRSSSRTGPAPAGRWAPTWWPSRRRTA